MTDIHSHILPGLDDGSETMEESLDMLRMAASEGTTDMVATPHANQMYTFDPDIVERKIAELREAAGVGPRVHYGCELHLTLENIEGALRSPALYSINHRGYLLVEFSELMVPKAARGIFRRMMDVGLNPIVAHPERNPLMQRNLDELEEWVAQGCVMQVTAHSLLGRFGKAAKAAGDALIQRGLVHCLASDAHDLKSRPPALGEAREYVEKTFGPEAAVLLMEENPRAIVSGGHVAAVTPRKKARFSLW